MYVEFLSRSLKSTQAIRSYVSGVRLLHKYLELSCDAADSFELSLNLRALDLTSDHRVKKKCPITPTLLHKICAALSSDPVDKIYKCLFLVAFFSFLRRSNLTPSAAAEFDKKKHLCRGDVFQTQEGLRLLIKWSKTIQARERVLLLPIPVLPDHPLCPVAAYTDMINTFPAAEDKPLFILPNGKPLLASHYTQRLSALVATLGLNNEDYSPHSFRRGGATLAFECQVDPLLIKSQGDWQSDAYLEYIDLSLDHRVMLTNSLASAVMEHTECT